MSFKAIVFLVLVMGTAGAVVARARLGPQPAAAPASPFGGSLVAQEPPPAAEERPRVEETLPYVTEAGFFAIIGFALGYASKKVLKLALILLALLFVTLQVLGWGGIVTVDWERAVEAANELVFNIKQDQTWKEVLKDRLPSAGGLLGGYVLGFRKG